jgi:hypothetical protein
MQASDTNIEANKKTLCSAFLWLKDAKETLKKAPKSKDTTKALEDLNNINTLMETLPNKEFTERLRQIHQTTVSQQL